MAEVIATERQAYNIGGQSYTGNIEDLRMVTKSRAISMLCDVNNASSYASNQLVKLIDLSNGGSFTIFINIDYQQDLTKFLTFFLTNTRSNIGTTMDISLCLYESDVEDANGNYIISASPKVIRPLRNNYNRTSNLNHLITHVNGVSFGVNYSTGEQTNLYIQSTLTLFAIFCYNGSFGYYPGYLNDDDFTNVRYSKFFKRPTIFKLPNVASFSTNKSSIQNNTAIFTSYSYDDIGWVESLSNNTRSILTLSGTNKVQNNQTYSISYSNGALVGSGVNTLVATLSNALTTTNSSNYCDRMFFYRIKLLSIDNVVAISYRLREGHTGFEWSDRVIFDPSLPTDEDVYLVLGFTSDIITIEDLCLECGEANSTVEDGLLFKYHINGLVESEDPDECLYLISKVSTNINETSGLDYIDSPIPLSTETTSGSVCDKIIHLKLDLYVSIPVPVRLTFNSITGEFTLKLLNVTNYSGGISITLNSYSSNSATATPDLTLTFILSNNHNTYTSYILGGSTLEGVYNNNTFWLGITDVHAVESGSFNYDYPTGKLECLIQPVLNRLTIRIHGQADNWMGGYDNPNVNGTSILRMIYIYACPLNEPRSNLKEYIFSTRDPNDQDTVTLSDRAYLYLTNPESEYPYTRRGGTIAIYNMDGNLVASFNFIRNTSTNQYLDIG